MQKFVEELKRRHVFRFAGIYVVAAWLLLQVADVVVPAAGLPEWLVTFVLYLMIVGFPFALGLSWMFDLTGKGVAQDSQDAATNRFNLASPAVLLVVAAFAGSSFVAYKISQPPLEVTQSIAVVPFVNLTGDENQEFLADGITDEILSRLFRLDNLKVIARLSSFKLKGQDLELSEIGSQLGVENVLEGNFQINGSAVRLVVRMISVATGKRLWAETFDGELSDFEFQDDVTNTVTEAVSREFGRKPPPPKRVATREVLAQEHYLRGRYYMEQRGAENMERASVLFQQAIDVDPLYAEAWAALGQSIALGGFDHQIDDERIDAIVDRALEYDPENPRALTVKATLAGFRDWDFETALALRERIVAIAPGDGDARHWSAILLGLSGQFEAALAEQRIAAPLNPLYPPLLEGIGNRLNHLWRFEEAIAIYQQSIDNGFDRVYDNMYFAYGHLGRVEDATAVLLRPGWQTELDDWDRMTLAYFGGDREEASRLYKEHFLAERPPASESHLGAVRNALYGGDLDYAFEVLMLLTETKEINVIRMVRRKQPVELYSDPRWVELWNHPNLKPLFDLYLESGDAGWISIMNAAITEREAKL